MAIENVAKFEELLRTGEELKAKLDEAAAAWAGDLADEKAAFEELIAPLAEELGLPFTYEEGRESFASQDLGDEEIDAVAGGKGFCYLIGGSSDVEGGHDVCVEPGFWCAYIGVSTGGNV